MRAFMLHDFGVRRYTQLLKFRTLNELFLLPLQVERLPSRLHAATGKLADHVSSTGLVSMIKSAADKIPFSSAAAAAEHVVHVGARGIYSRVGPHVGRLAKSAVDLQETMTDGLVQKLDKMNEAYQQTIGQNGS
jgi:hypothetical protein